jgi:hypothetical protein
MAGQDKVHEGACRCGRVRFRVIGEPILTMACHCTGCQRMTASAFSLSSHYPADRFEVTSGEPVIGGLREATRHLFCSQCMSWLFTRPEGLDGHVNVRATLLDNAPAFQPFIQTYTSERLPWARTPALHSFERFPALGDYPGLLASYAEHLQGRPAVQR